MTIIQNARTSGGGYVAHRADAAPSPSGRSKPGRRRGSGSGTPARTTTRSGMRLTALMISKRHPRQRRAHVAARRPPERAVPLLPWRHRHHGSRNALMTLAAGRRPPRMEEFPMHRFSGSLPAATALVLAASATSAQRGPAPDPLVRENATVKMAAHTYVIPDGERRPRPERRHRRRQSRDARDRSRDWAGATAKPCCGRSRRSARTPSCTSPRRTFIPSTRRATSRSRDSAKYINSTVQEEEFAESGMQMVQTFAGRSPAHGRAPEGCGPADGGRHLRS